MARTQLTSTMRRLVAKVPEKMLLGSEPYLVLRPRTSTGREVRLRFSRLSADLYSYWID
jgi:hypothetical protein